MFFEKYGYFLLNAKMKHESAGSILAQGTTLRGPIQLSNA